MQCPNCDTEILSLDSKFCSCCGYKLSNSDNLNSTKIKFPINKKTIIFLGLVLLVLSFTMIQSYNSVNSNPENVINRFFNNLQNKNYEKAFKNLDTTKLQSSPFLSKESFEKALSLAPIKNFTIEEADTALYKTIGEKVHTMFYNVSIYSDEVPSKNFIIKLTKKNDDWLIEPFPFIIKKSIYIPQDKNIEVTVNDIKLDLKDTNSDKEYDFFIYSPVVVKYQGSNIKPLVVDMNNLNDTSSIVFESAQITDSKPDTQASKEDPNNKDLNNNLDFIFPNSSTRELSVYDLKNLTKYELGIARNEIYARHGYVFSQEPFKSYFQGKDWYVPNPEFKGLNNDLYPVEYKNVQLILEYEKSRD
ncbi:hypothetical protein JOC70_001870 [Clostridium pascui]|uniref:YARHG domain-containing protein n=1 Tax=Clostridium pascui TaxID=46609 RepID=UPI00195E9DAD|nr:YARHG domain-containing protein [Clostridium pascui]MBM7870385.1 hypothetical protein [Clostridium pascui]